MKNICIIYAGGMYGTFIEWCLNYFTNINFSNEVPFNSNGNSHKFTGNLLDDFNSCCQYVESDIDHQFVRFHLRVKKTDDDPFENFGHVYQNFQKVIFLYCTANSIAWCINNRTEKIIPTLMHPLYPSEVSDLVKKWGIDKTMDNMDRWELREFLSIFSYPQYVSESSMELVTKFKTHYPNAVFVSVENLRDNFKQSILDIIECCRLPLIRHDFDHIYDQWVALQFHKDKDTLINTIVNALITDTYIDWSNTPLTLIDEALIQHYLRENKIKIKCFELNKFPTNTSSFKEYLHYVA